MTKNLSTFLFSLIILLSIQEAFPSPPAVEGLRVSRRSQVQRRKMLPSATKGGIPQERVERAIQRLIKQADVYWHRGDYPSVAEMNRIILELDPHFVEAWSNLGWILWAGLNDEAEAEKILLQGLKLNPRRYEMYYEIGFFYYRRKEYSKALKYLKQSVQFSPPPVVWNLYAHSLEKSGNPSQAAAIWRWMAKHFPNFPLSRVNLDRLKRHNLIKAEEANP